MRHSQYIDLFKAIAISHAEIRHSVGGRLSFARILAVPTNPLEGAIYLEEFLNINKNLTYPVLLVFSYEHNFSGEPDQDNRKYMSGMFAVIDRVDRIKDFDLEQDVIDKTERISEEILAKLYHHVRIDFNCQFSSLPEDLSGHKIGPIANNCFGQMNYFSISKPTYLFDEETALNPTIWL